MQELIDDLERSSEAQYLLDTCFLLNLLEKDRYGDLALFCETNNVGMSSFNLQEIMHVHHRLKGTVNHHMRNFLKQKLIKCVPMPVKPGERENEKRYVESFDRRLLQLVHDPSDAVLLVLALRIGANVLTKDRHHLFTTAAENYFQGHKISILNELPRTLLGAE